MELEDLRSDLLSLWKLYRLLRYGGEGISKALLDDQVKLLLNSLLCNATERVVKAHPEIISNQGSASWTKKFDQSAEFYTRIRQQPMDLQSLSQSSAAPEYGNDLDDLGIAKSKEECILAEATGQANGLQQSKFDNSAGRSGIRKRKCDICQKEKMELASSSQEVDLATLIETPAFSTLWTHNGIPIRSLYSGDQHHNGLEEQSSIQSCSETLGEEVQKFVFHSLPSDYEYKAYSLQCPKVGIQRNSWCNHAKEADMKLEESHRGEASDVIRQMEFYLSPLKLKAENLNQYARCKSQGNLYGAVKTPEEKLESLSAEDELTSQSEEGQTGEILVKGRELLPQLVSHVRMDVDDQENVRKISQLKKLSRDLRESLAPNLLEPSETTLNQLRIFGNKSNTRDLLASDEETLRSYEEDLCQRQSRDQVTGQDVKATVEKYKSLGRAVNQCPHVSKQMQNGSSLGIPHNRKMVTEGGNPLPGNWETQIKAKSHDQHLMLCMEDMRKLGTSKDYASFMDSADFAFRGSNSGLDEDREHLQLQTLSQILPNRNSCPSNDSITLRRNFRGTDVSRTQTRNDLHRPMMKVVKHRRDFEDADHCSYSSSCKSDQARIGDSQSEEFSESEPTQRSQHLSSTTFTESEINSLVHTGSPYMGSTESSSYEVYSSSSAARSESWSSTSGSESQSYSSFGQLGSRNFQKQSTYFSDVSSSSISSPHRVYRSPSRVKQKKKVGGLKKLKDKLAIIFHHHHHHHHHHNHTEEQSKHGRKVSCSTPFENSSADILDPTRKSEVAGKGAVGKLRKSAINDGYHKKQHSHFRDLVTGLLKHVRRSKKSNPAKQSARQLGIGQMGNKKVPKSHNWWQLLRHRGGTDMHSKLDAKYRVGGHKKSHLRALPKAI